MATEDTFEGITSQDVTFEILEEWRKKHEPEPSEEEKQKLREWFSRHE